MSKLNEPSTKPESSPLPDGPCPFVYDYYLSLWAEYQAEQPPPPESPGQSDGGSGDGGGVPAELPEHADAAVPPYEPVEPASLPLPNPAALLAEMHATPRDAAEDAAAVPPQQQQQQPTTYVVLDESPTIEERSEELLPSPPTHRPVAKADDDDGPADTDERFARLAKAYRELLAEDPAARKSGKMGAPAEDPETAEMEALAISLSLPSVPTTVPKRPKGGRGGGNGGGGGGDLPAV